MRVPFLSWDPAENYKCIFILTLPSYAPCTKHELFFFLYVPRSWRASVILCASLTWVPLGCVGAPAPHSVASACCAVKPVSFSVSTAHSHCHFTLLLSYSLMNTRCLDQGPRMCPCLPLLRVNSNYAPRDPFL